MAKREDEEKNGIDIDRIKTWINDNTQKMLQSKDLKEKLETYVKEKESIEDRMIDFGERLTDLMLLKERKEVEKVQLEAEAEVDEGKLLELEEELDQILLEMNQITESLDSLDDTIDHINKKINVLCEEIAAVDADNIEPLKFSGLKSIDAARVTLQTFFGVLLDLNIYKRDLEQKCIE